MTDVERFFRRLVNQLAASDPGRLRQPVPLDDIYRDILPYRAHRRALKLDTSEEYELVLLRLCAGEGDLVLTEPEEARERFVQELKSPNPDLDVLRSFEEVQITIRAEPLMRALDPLPTRSTRGPPRPEPESDPEPALVLGAAQFDDLPGLSEIVPPDAEALGVTGRRRGIARSRRAAASRDRADAASTAAARFPTTRPVNFCPHCGQSQTQILCPECRSEVEPGWRHCVNCGAAVGEA